MKNRYRSGRPESFASAATASRAATSGSPSSPRSASSRTRLRASRRTDVQDRRSRAYSPDGNIEFLGRRDRQVKIRGHRVELEEVEAAITGLPQVREAAVVVHEFAPGDRRLIAYFATNGDRHATVDELRGFLRRSLPDYMVPAAFVHVDQFPLTSGGKIDRKALPVPEVAAYASRAYEAPVGEIETALARIWADVLKIERVGRHDHFFELGGHSLLAVTLFERMRQAGLHADVRTLFVTPTLAELATALDSDGYGAPTIADLAGHISAALLGDEQDRTLAIKPQPRAMQLPLSFAQQRLWFLEQWDPGHALYNIAAGWWLHGPLDSRQAPGSGDAARCATRSAANGVRRRRWRAPPADHGRAARRRCRSPI